MEKILEKYFLEDTCEVIEKHISYHREEIRRLFALKELYEYFDEDSSSVDLDLEAHSGAIASLVMLMNELKGEKVY